jgi:hypothetical protein
MIKPALWPARGLGDLPLTAGGYHKNISVSSTMISSKNCTLKKYIKEREEEEEEEEERER